MSVVVFAGPTVAAAEIRDRLACTVLPPAAVGDVLRAVHGTPRAIGLIDGVFERVLPVWHKEILWALSRGVHVFGAASMGALRAAELHAFGMVGVGRIFQGYRDGELEADDEVAVLHGPVEVGFAAVTEALVNVRATVEHARSQAALDKPEAHRVLAAARAVHYRERTWETVLAQLGEPALVARLRDWLRDGRIDQKRIDALALVEHLAAFVADDPAPLAVGFPFAWTDAWDALYQRAYSAAGSDQDVLDELRLEVDRVGTVRRAALLRVLARRETERSGAAPGAAARAAAGERLRARLGLWRRADLEHWLRACDLDAAGFAALVADEAMAAELEATARAALEPAMLAELRASGGYPALAGRAKAKARALTAAGLDAVSAARAGVDPAPLLARLAERVDGGVADTDLARRLGFLDRAAMQRAALRELLFLRMMQDKEGAT